MTPCTRPRRSPGPGAIGQNDLDDAATGSGESKRGDLIVEAAGFPEQSGEQVLVQGQLNEPLGRHCFKFAETCHTSGGICRCRSQQARA